MQVPPTGLRRWIWGALACGIAGLMVFLLWPDNGDDDVQDAPPPAPVVLMRVEGAPLSRTIEAIANVQSAESVIVTAETSGRIAAILFREGQRVRRGQPLVRLVNDQQAADLAAARAEAAELRQRLERQRRLVAEGAIPRGQVDDLARQVQAAEARANSLRVILDNTTVRAPFAGVIGLRAISPGAFVNPGDELAAIEDDSSVRLRFTVPEAQLRSIRVGASVEARTPSIADRSFRAQVTSIDTRVGSGQRTLEAEARLPNPDGLWRAGMLADIRIAVETVSGALRVPPLAVQVRGPVQFLFRAVQGCAERVEVETGERGSDRLEILSGLSSGDLLVVEGFEDLSSGDPVRAIRPDGGRSGKGDEEAGGASGDGDNGEGDDAEPTEQELKANAQARDRCARLIQQRRQAREKRTEQPQSTGPPAR